MDPEPEIILDLSRLLSRVLHATPTGVDRCEMAYARGLLATVPDRLNFAAVHPSKVYGRLPHRAVLRFLDATESRWNHRGFASAWDTRAFAARALIALRPRTHTQRLKTVRPLFVQASPNNLTDARLMKRILKKENARFLCLVHDLIPLEFPEYARTNGAKLHESRVRTILQCADGIVCNSQSTLDALAPWMERMDRHPVATVAHLGTHFQLSHNEQRENVSQPYFVCIGTIEPRKNHLLLLNVWRRLSEMYGASQIPKLLIIGRRGWENEQVVDMLERCPALIGCVKELNSLPDDKVSALLSGARALLLPSFAEGYGMPVTEALSLSVPVLCSDLAPLREAGGTAPEFLDPLDGPAWLQAIRDYTFPSSIRRGFQLQRLRNWVPPTWERHLSEVLNLAKSIA